MRKELLIHISLWLTYLLIRLYNNYTYHPSHITLFWIELLFTALVAAEVYVLTYYILPKALKPRQFFYLGTWLVSSFMVFMVLDYMIEGPLAAQLYGGEQIPFTADGFVIPILKVYISFGLLGLAYYYVREVHTERSYKLKLEKDKLETEIAYLRAQINPHFLFNTLNSITNKVYEADQDSAEQMSRLGRMMRYSIEKPDTDGKVLLRSEIEAIEDLIHLYQFNQSNKLQVVFNKPEHTNGIRIHPHLLLTLVENAFKHGQLENPQHPIVINLSIEHQHHAIIFSIENHKRRNNSLLKNGFKSNNIGLENIRRRLSLHYPGHYSFRVNENASSYTSELIIS
jgi:two-component system, LytTR family, sensor kinase